MIYAVARLVPWTLVVPAGLLAVMLQLSGVDLVGMAHDWLVDLVESTLLVTAPVP